MGFRNDPKFSDIQALANSADPDQTAHVLLQEQSDQGLHCSSFQLHLSDTISLWIDLCLNFTMISASF